MDSEGRVSCQKCGSTFRLEYTRSVFSADTASLPCPTCLGILHSYDEARTYYIAEILEVRRNHEPAR